MKLADIKQKNDKELAALAADTRKQLADVLVEMRTKQFSNVKQINAIKKTLARTLTVQRERELKQLEESNG
jgi:ribosomal protein L29